MVVKPHRHWLAELLSFRATSLRECLPRVMTATGLALVVTLIERQCGVGVLDLTPVPFSLMGVAIGIFLGFRGKTAYDRFWEGRTLWGALINHCRNSGRQIHTVLQAPASDRIELERLQRRLTHLLIAFAHSLRHHLRETAPWPDLQPWMSLDLLEQLKGQRNVPLAILQQMGEELVEARRRNWLHDYHLPLLEGTLVELTNILGGCERIKNTPVPYAYGVLSHRVVAAFCFFLPFGIVDQLKSYTPFVTALVSYAFFGLDSLGAEVEEPFGTDPHDLPLAAMCRTIEVNLLQMLGEPQLPGPVEPVDCVLL